MKKTFLTFVAVGFGLSVAFAQTTDPQEETQQGTEIQTEQTDTMYGQDEEGRRQIEMHELPVAVQDAFKNGQYKGYEVLAIYEVSPEAQTSGVEGTTGTETTQDVAGVQQGVLYEIELVAEGESGAYGNQQTVEEDGMETTVETEPVSERAPDVVLMFDETGQLIKEEQPEEKQY